MKNRAFKSQYLILLTTMALLFSICVLLSACNDPFDSSAESTAPTEQTTPNTTAITTVKDTAAHSSSETTAPTPNTSDDPDAWKQKIYEIKYSGLNDEEFLTHLQENVVIREDGKYYVGISLTVDHSQKTKDEIIAVYNQFFSDHNLDGFVYTGHTGIIIQIFAYMDLEEVKRIAVLDDVDYISFEPKGSSD